jgi:hypothetical protein
LQSGGRPHRARTRDGAVRGVPPHRAEPRLSVLALVASGMGTRSSLTLGLAALILWAVSWSWLVGVGVTVVRVGELGAIVAGLAAVAVGVTTRPRSAGFWLGIVVLVLVVGLNVLGPILR